MNDEVLDLLGRYGIEEFDNGKFNNHIDAFKNNDIKIFNSEHIDVANEEVLCLMINSNSNSEDLRKEIESIDFQKGRGSITEVFIFEIRQNPLSKEVNSSREIKEIRKIVQKEFKDSFDKKISLTNITYESFVINDVPDKEDIFISIDNRIKSLEREIDLSDSLSLKGYVFSAKLEDVLQLYNVMGTTLFEKNLRFSIGEQLSVDASIIETIEINSSEFWFLNNGISLYVEDENQLDLSLHEKIKLTLGKENKVSVINGAQTITSSSRADFEDKNSYVLLRIFVYKGNLSNNKDRISSELDKITVALNRQKPIKSEDVAYTYDFILEINNIMLEQKNEVFKFQLIRRGEIESNISNRYLLINFARITKAYLDQKPGDARSKGANTLLRKVSGEEMNFKDNSIFVNFTENSPEESETKFLANYKPVNFAFKLKSYLTESNLNKIKDDIIIDDDDTQDNSKKKIHLDALINYGKYLLIAFIIHDLNKDRDDYMEWKYTDIQSLPKEDYIFSENSLTEKLIEIFNKFNNFCIEKNFDSEDLNANTFKKDDIYHDFKSFAGAN